MEMKLIRLRSIANNVVRSSNWTTSELTSAIDPFEHVQPRSTFIVDLITGVITWETEDGKEILVSDDDVEKYYKAMTQWFHQALEKEGIPLEVIESAIIKITPEEKQCTIVADGKTFESMKMAMSS